MNLINEQKPLSEEKRISVLDFYRGKKVFVTGGTGFLGKVIIEKLLRQLEVETIYILVREKKGKSIHSRIDEMTDDIYYDDLKKSDPKFKHKLVPINGDCAYAGLGLSITDVQTLIENVEIVLHCAATVRFNEPLDKSYAVNVTGTKGVVNLCHSMHRLQAFVHVSTAYSNCHLSHIEERFYDYSLGADEIAALLTKLTPDEIDAKTRDIIGNWPNSYTFTKALAENLIRTECEKLPVAVFRPAIILSTYQGATPGWIDNIYGPVGASASIYAGFGRVVYVAQDDSCNVVPVDKVADGIFAAAWEVGTRIHRKCEDVNEKIKIYNYVSSSTKNTINWKEYIYIGSFYSREFPLLNTKRTLNVTMARSETVYNILILLLHYIPALIIDFFMLLSGNKPKLFRLYKKLHSQMAAVLFFVCHAWSFDNNNVQKLYETLSLEDRRLLPMDMHDVNWKLFMKNYILGIRRYVLKEDDSTLEPARKKLKTMERLDNFIKCAICFFIANYIYGVVCATSTWLLFG
ncbi:fatty acyl-CoA reductase wat-like [Atheta coriaria]|uniref:fatty acyl-CoA reductase wat-like n=1 Tax=Dalotia coriaria TaxID=877792 RepID=UPI0031F3C009